MFSKTKEGSEMTEGTDKKLKDKMKQGLVRSGVRQRTERTVVRGN
jgi:hypothetical protein